MSVDKEPQMDEMDKSARDAGPKKSGSKRWLTIGLVFGVIVLVGVIGTMYWLKVGKPIQEFKTQNLNMIDESEIAAETLGTPITLGTVGEKRDGDSITFRVPAKGAEASGTLVFTGTKGPEGWTRDEIYLEVDGEKVDLSAIDELFNLDISEGF
jgi:hypothetical protein